MKKIISLIACFSIAVFAQQEQYQYPQHQPPQVQCQCQCPPQREYQYQYQYQFPPQQQQQVVNMEQLRKVQKLIEDGIEKNKGEILAEALYLSPADIDALYEKNKMNAIGYAALGGSIGLGIGSYMQGNILFGLMQTALDGFGLTIIIFGTELGPVPIIMGISRVAGLIVPFVYQNSYNKTLKDALNGNNLSYSIDPLIVPKDGGAPAVGLAFNLRY